MPRVAAVQFCPKFKDVPANLRKMAGLISQAAGQKAKLIVLPELATTGYSFMSVDEALPLAEIADKGGRTFDLMATLSKKLGVTIVWGMMEQDKGTKKLHNSQVLVKPDGAFVKYQKVNPFGQDWIWSTPGRSNPPVIEVEDFGKVGLLICRDVRDKVNDKWESFYEKGDADVVAFSANWGRGGFPATAWMEFVDNNKIPLIVSNRYGEEANNDFGGGGVCIIHEDKRVECDGLAWGQDCIVLGEI